MPETSFHERNGFSLEDVLAWLTRPADPDPLAELVLLRQALHALACAEVPAAHRLRIAEIFAPRLQAAHNAVLESLLDFPQPLPRSLGDITQAVIEIHGLMAEILLDVALELTTSEQYPVRRPIEQVTMIVMHAVQCKLDLSLLAFGQVPHAIWLNCAAVTRFPLPGGASNNAELFGQMLALSAAQPESFTPRELNYLRTVLQLFNEQVDMIDSRDHGGRQYFWLDTNQDAPPVASSRRNAPNTSSLLRFRFDSLIASLDPVIEQLATGVPASELGMPKESNQADYLNVLRRMRLSLAEPPRRQFPRRRQSHAVRVCARLSEFWSLLSRQVEDSGEFSDWKVINKSPDGCALELETGKVSGLMAGGALGIRESEKMNWSVCLIRWIRGGVADQIELGLEFMAPQAHPVRLVYGEANHETIPGLLLPALPKLNRPETLLVGRGRREGREFNLITENAAGKISFSVCRPSTLVQQTSSIEIFEFERLRTPD